MDFEIIQQLLNDKNYAQIRDLFKSARVVDIADILFLLIK